MAFCHNCGNELAPENKFCAKCGASIEDAPKFTPTPQTVTEEPPKAPKPPKKPIDKKKLGITIGIIAAVIVLVVAAVLVITGINKKKKQKAANERKKVVISDFITTTFEGYDSIGSAGVRLDKEDLCIEILYSSGINLKKDKDGNYEEPDFDNMSKSDKEKFTLTYSLYTSFYTELDKRNNLSNGDKVEVDFSYDEEIAKKLGVNIIFEPYEVEVTGLDPVKEVNPFDAKYFSVIQSGKNGNIKVEFELQSEDDWLKDIYFDYDGWSHSIGDVVEFTINDNSCENILSYYGIKITERSYKYTIEKADVYVQDVKDIGEAVDSFVASKADELIEEKCSTELSYEITNTELMGKYLFAKSDYNAAYYIYKISMTLKNKKVIEGYAAIKVDNIVQCINGEQIYSEYVSMYNDEFYIDDIKIKTYESEVALFDYLYGRDMGEGVTFTKSEALTSYLVDFTEDELKEIGELAAKVYNAINEGDEKTLKELTFSSGMISAYFEKAKEVDEMIAEDLEDYNIEYGDVELGDDTYVYTLSQIDKVIKKMKSNDIEAPEFEKIVSFEVKYNYHDNYWKEDGSNAVALTAYKEDGKWYILYFLDYFNSGKLTY